MTLNAHEKTENQAEAKMVKEFKCTIYKGKLVQPTWHRKLSIYPIG